MWMWIQMQVKYFLRFCTIHSLSRNHNVVMFSSRPLAQNPSLPVPGSTCGLPSLNSEVIATPTKAAYQIGDRVSLSCPAGSVLDGEVSEMLCSPSLQWSPSPATAHCKAGTAHLFSALNVSDKPIENSHQLCRSP